MTIVPAPWTAALINHLWQSTVFALAAGLLTFALRKNQARTRYWLWMAASAKFLVPFSLLIAAGAWLRPATAVPVPNQALSTAMTEIAEPFFYTSSPATVSNGAVAANNLVTHGADLFPVLLLTLWACGSLIVAFSWWRKWSTIRATVRAASPIALAADVPVLSSPSLLEPGVFGILQPVLLLPEGITDRLTKPQMGAIVAHEMCHVRRRDNLTAAIHMLVEAAFWFNPMVWWIRTRLVEERERACDEAVLLSGSEAHVYAEGILNVCKFYVESPLACVSGVTGSNLKKRIVLIMAAKVSRKLDFTRKLLLSASALAAVTLPVTFGLLHATSVHAQSDSAKSIEGNWQGTLNAGGKDLRLIVEVSKDDGRLKGVFHSIDQPVGPIKISSLSLDGSTFKFAVDLAGATYEGKLAADGNSIAGTWTQGNSPLPLNFARATKTTAWEIPAPPPPPKQMPADADPSFEVATIKPNNSGGARMQQLTINGRNFDTVNSSLGDLMEFGFGIQAKQIVGAPDWLDKDRFDIHAVPDVEGAPNVEQLKVMIQKLLKERFKMTFHHDKREMSAFVLTVGKNGAKVTPTELNGPLPGLGMRPGKTGPSIVVRNGSMGNFTGFLQALVLDRPVVDQTGLTGKYDLTVTFTPDDSQFNGHPPPFPKIADDVEPAPGLFEAIQQQLGLKLSPEKTQVDVIAIDHVEKYSAN